MTALFLDLYGEPLSIGSAASTSTFRARHVDWDLDDLTRDVRTEVATHPVHKACVRTRSSAGEIVVRAFFVTDSDPVLVPLDLDRLLQFAALALYQRDMRGSLDLSGEYVLVGLPPVWRDAVIMSVEREGWSPDFEVARAFAQCRLRIGRRCPLTSPPDWRPKEASQ